VEVLHESRRAAGYQLLQAIVEDLQFNRRDAASVAGGNLDDLLCAQVDNTYLRVFSASEAEGAVSGHRKRSGAAGVDILNHE